ncbi:Tn3 family transposase [Conexibacter sp. W3-3-2]|uniref:Tn3 family transposase n=1 Tax=Conexibacter sp. W3-3-2 TaxID=2675227 RepID=UPI0035C91EDE
MLGRIPEIELADLLIEVDAWTSFTDELRHVAGATPRAGQLPERPYAAVVASGTLLGPVAMARICELSYRQIAWAQEWYLDVENVRAASRRITDYHHRLELTQHLGSGLFSSSDGHRVGQRGKPPTAAMLAREFGHHHGGLTVMSWTLDDYSTYGAKIVSVSDREATHSLDAIVHAHAPDIREHTTDTHGYTDIVFALLAKGSWIVGRCAFHGSSFVSCCGCCGSNGIPLKLCGCRERGRRSGTSDRRRCVERAAAGVARARCADEGARAVPGCAGAGRGARAIGVRASS